MADIKITDGWDTSFVSPVDFVSVMGNDDAVCDAARVSFDKKAAGYSVEKNNKLIKYLAKHDHWSPFAHCYLKFRFRAPLFVARQFQKHTVGFAWNEVSRRYVDNKPTFFVPHSFRKRPDNMKQGSVTEGETLVRDDVLDDVLEQYKEASINYRGLLDRDVCPEQARMFLPQSMMTEWIWTGSLMAWARFVKLRADSHAQYECWVYAQEVLHSMMDHFPLSARALINSKESTDEQV